MWEAPISDPRSPTFDFRETKRQNRFLISVRVLEMEMALFVQRDLLIAGDRRGRVGVGGCNGTRGSPLGIGRK